MLSVIMLSVLAPIQKLESEQIIIFPSDGESFFTVFPKHFGFWVSIHKTS